MNAATQAETNALTLPERASVALSSPVHEVKLRELVKASAAILTVTNKAGRDECHSAYMTLKNTRVAINHTVDEVTEDAKKFTKAVKAEATRLLMITLAEEERLQNLRDAWDDAEQARKDALIAAERARVEAIQARITEVRNLPAGAIGKTAVEISQMIYELAGTISADDAHAATFDEFADEYKSVRGATLELLAQAERKQLGVEADARAVEQARIAEAERLAAERAENARVKAENERIANEQAAERQRLAALAAAQEAAAEKLRAQAEANLKAEREAQAEVVRIERAKMAAEQAKVAEQVAKLAAQQAAADKRDADALAAKQAAEARDKCHGEALEMNAQFDIDAAAVAEVERVRLQNLAEQAVADARMPTSDLEALMDLVDAGEMSIKDLPIQDSEIIELVAETFGMTLADAIDRLGQIDFAAARANLP